jgi:UDP-N-acetylmuramate--alanine ligase
VIRYGLGKDMHVRATEVIALPGSRMHFRCERRNGAAMPALDITLNLAGVHNVRNALAAIAVATELELPDAPVVKALAQFSGVGRRFQRYGELPARDGGRFTLIDDSAGQWRWRPAFAAARGRSRASASLAFQPHRYNRTAIASNFVRC